MFLIRRFPDYQFFGPPMLRHWTENPSQAVHFADKQIAVEQANRLPFVTEIVPAPSIPEGPRQ
jgi:hypothetical protein